MNKCGNGILEGLEKCDDGNRSDSDGCDAYCRKEREPPKQIEFPVEPSVEPIPYQLPLASLVPLMQQRAPAGDTGPVATMLVAIGAATGVGWMRRRKK